MADRAELVEEFEDAVIENVPHRSWLEDFVWGVLAALPLVGIAFVGWSLIATPPANLPSGGPVEISRPDPTIPDPATPDPATNDVAAPDSVATAPVTADPTSPEGKITAASPEISAAPETPAGPQATGEEVTAVPAEDPAPGTDLAPDATQVPEVTTPAAPPFDVSAAAAPDPPATPPTPDVTEPEPAGDNTQPAPAEDTPPETASPEPIDLQAPPEDAPEDPAPPTALVLEGPALQVNARTFEAPADMPLVAIVLTGATPGAIPAEGLALMRAPLTFAVPADPVAAQFGDIVRAAGHEVLAEIGALSAEGPPPEDLNALQISLEQGLAALPMAVGVASPAGQPLVTDRRVLEAALETIAPFGHAFIDLRAGIGTTARSMATQQGIPFAAGDRYSGAEATEEQIFQAIEGAAFKARREGTAVVAVAASATALRAIVNWGLSVGGGEVRLAPISAVVRRRAGG